MCSRHDYCCRSWSASMPFSLATCTMIVRCMFAWKDYCRLGHTCSDSLRPVWIKPGDREQQHQLKVSPLMDRNDATGMTKSQVPLETCSLCVVHCNDGRFGLTLEHHQNNLKNNFAGVLKCRQMHEATSSSCRTSSVLLKLLFGDLLRSTLHACSRFRLIRMPSSFA